MYVHLMNNQGLNFTKEGKENDKYYTCEKTSEEKTNTLGAVSCATADCNVGSDSHHLYRAVRSKVWCYTERLQAVAGRE